jgi:hypothetical protein
MAQASLKLGDVAKVGVNMPEADFWVVRRGSEREVGRPVKTFNPEHFGIKVTQTDVLDPGHCTTRWSTCMARARGSSARTARSRS